ncbi:Hypothetical protein, putative [Bodo saltans]|uniref:Uncharacterized protein n=1 Tax=Bodo saltans TaxID=75058 RepID=A0A0S4KF63_BODSA|nr:Hypothetical protein, putative [Bodo saltans]|eukprot:CUI14308.1 Hypothetical protein, putative [Bodo saltans]
MRVEGHSVVKFENFLYIFGGFDLESKKETNATYRLDIADIERGLTQSSNDISAAHASYPMAAAAGGENNSAAGLFGGPEGGKAAAMASRAYMYNMMSAAMQQQPAADQAAPAGGISSPFWRGQSAASVSEDVLMYPVNTTGLPPPPRAHHACCMRGPYMVVWGGSQSNTDDESLLGGPTSSSTSSSSSLGVTELFALNLETLVWSTYVVASVAPHVKQQFVPQQRCHATMVCAEDALLLFGGYPTTIQRGEEALGFAPNEWRVFRVSGDGLCERLKNPQARHRHCGDIRLCTRTDVSLRLAVLTPTLTKRSTLFVCITWTSENGDGPSFLKDRAPEHFTALCSTLPKLPVYGGFSSSANEDESFGDPSASPFKGGSTADGANPIVAQLQDVWSFSLETGLWEKIFPSAIGAASRAGGGSGPSWAPPGRSGHASVYHNHRMFVIGGLVEKPDGPSSPARGGTGTAASWNLLQNNNNSGTTGRAAAASSSGGGDLLIFDLHSRRWKAKNIITAKTSVTSSSSVNVPAAPPGNNQQRSIVSIESHHDGTEHAQRESIIDKYLNISASPSSNAVTPNRSTLRGAASGGPRTVGSARAASAQGAAPSPLVVKSNPIGTPASLQQALVSSVFHEAITEQRKRQLIGGERSSSPMRWADDNAAAARRSSSRETDDYADALLGNATVVGNRSPLSTQRSLTNEVLHSYRTPPRGATTDNNTNKNIFGSGGSSSRVVSSPLLMPTSAHPPAAAVPFTRMHQMVSSIAEQQSAADLRWTAAENERRSKLLMQYLTTHGDPSSSPWASMTSHSGLQDDESEGGGARLQHAIRPQDPRMIISGPSSSPLAQSSSFGSSSTRRPSSVSVQAPEQHYTGRTSIPQYQSLPQRAASSEILDSDEMLSSQSHTVQPHPLAPGPWLP